MLKPAQSQLNFTQLEQDLIHQVLAIWTKRRGGISFCWPFQSRKVCLELPTPTTERKLYQPQVQLHDAGSNPIPGWLRTGFPYSIITISNDYWVVQAYHHQPTEVLNTAHFGHFPHCRPAAAAYFGRAERWRGLGTTGHGEISPRTLDRIPRTITYVKSIHLVNYCTSR